MRAARRAAVVFLGWGLLLGAATAVQAPFGPRVIEYGLLGGACAACLLTGIAMWLWDLRHWPVGERPRLVANTSVATMALAIGLSVALVGAGFGLWLILMGAGIAALGAGGMLREARARKRAQLRTGRWIASSERPALGAHGAVAHRPSPPPSRGRARERQ